MSAETTLARLRAQNAEHQRRYRERQKAADLAAYKARNAERQRLYRERKASELAREATPAEIIMAHVTARPGVTAPALFAQLSLSKEVFIAAVTALVRDGRMIYEIDDRLTPLKP